MSVDFDVFAFVCAPSCVETDVFDAWINGNSGKCAVWLVL